jgi:hypothetical protein
MSKKAKGVIEALKGKKGFGSSKGVALLAIVKKLSAKRKAMGKKEVAHEKAESKAGEMAEDSEE